MRKLSFARLFIVVCMVWVVIIIGKTFYFTSTNQHQLSIGVPFFHQHNVPKQNIRSENIASSSIERLLTYSNLTNSDLHGLQDMHRLRYIIDNVNKVQKIRNHRFGPDISVSGTVILIQVHSREKELQILVQSLKEVIGIETTLVVFSYDMIIPSITQIIDAIDFCPVLQIFYPYSLQIYNGHFPADSPNDCPRNKNKQKAQEIGCSNAAHPDGHGHYREAKFTQMKHHWSWKLNYVFDSITMLKNFQGMLLRIDNDYYLAPDILHVMGMMRKVGNYDSSQMLIMGNHEVFSQQDYSQHTFTSGIWFTGVGRGMGFTKQVWEKISACSEVFCTFDDYNWDWSFEKMVTSCMNGLGILKPVGSRVFHVGQCHGFHKNSKCTPEQVTKRIKNYLNRNKKYMFPQNMIFHKTISVNRMQRVGYGGWADPRDHQLCKAIFKSKVETENTISSYY